MVRELDFGRRCENPRARARAAHQVVTTALRMLGGRLDTSLSLRSCHWYSRSLRGQSWRVNESVVETPAKVAPRSVGALTSSARDLRHLRLLHLRSSIALRGRCEGRYVRGIADRGGDLGALSCRVDALGDAARVLQRIEIARKYCTGGPRRLR